MKKKVLWYALAIFIVVVAVIGWRVYDEYRFWTRPWGKPDQQIIVNIEEGMTARKIAGLLKQNGVIRDPKMFLAIADLRGFSNKIRAGEYEIRGASTPYEIVDMLATGYVYRRALVVPEGFTQAQIAERCGKLEICTKEDFLAETQQHNIFTFVIAQAPGGANAACEGLLFPATYYFEKNTPAVKIVTRMTGTYENVWNDLYDEATKVPNKVWWWQDEKVSMLVNMNKVVVLASIIEKEAKRPEDRPKMASVFVNRMKKGMALQSDSTVRYAINDWSRPLTKSDLDFDSPYNTYKHTGLPPAAISNPGRAALKAAMMPENTTYLFFITTDNGETVYSSTYDEHVRMKNQLKQERKLRAAEVEETVPEATAATIKPATPVLQPAMPPR